MIYSEVQLTKLAQEDPEYLSKILSNPNINTNTLTFGIEILASETQDEKLFLDPAKILLKHVHAVVREGACLAIAAFYSDKIPPQEIIDRLRWLSSHDPSPAVKETAIGYLEDISRK